MDLDKIYKNIDENKDAFIEELKSWVRVKSVSSDDSCRPKCFDMIEMVANKLGELGCYVRIVDNPTKAKLSESKKSIKYPPIILASMGDNPSLKTVCVYGHLDVQPAEKSDGWNTEPFELTIQEDKMIGRGSSDDKGPVLGWLCLLRALKNTSSKLPINMKFVFECMEESGSEGLEEVITSEKNGFLKNIDYICISDNYWLGTEKPCVTYGLRGIAYFTLEVSGPSKDLHSGIYGGAVCEPMTDLFKIMSQLVDNKGKILIPGIYDQVAPVTDEEKKSIKKIDFDIIKFASGIDCTLDNLIYKDKCECLMHRWRFPTLSLHGVEGAFSQPGSKTVIPAKVKGKFSLRLVPNMDPCAVQSLVEKHIKSLAEDLKTPNKISLINNHAAPAWLGDLKSSNFTASIKATKRAYGVEPDLTREGGSIPITLVFEDITKKSVVLLPMGRGDDGAHSQNEKLNISNFITGIKLFASYIKELA